MKTFPDTTHVTAADLDITDVVRMGDETATITEVRPSRAFYLTMYLKYTYPNDPTEYSMTCRTDTPFERVS